MYKKPTRFRKIAMLVSIAGHPLLLCPAFTILVIFSLYPRSTAYFISALIIGLIACPLLVNNYLGTRKGSYTNFDVSDQQQRKKFYPVVLSLLWGTNLLLYCLNAPSEVNKGTFTFVIMISLFFLLKYSVKASLHVAVAAFIAISLAKLFPHLALILVVFSFFIAASRLVLQRHTFLEVLVGGVVGSVFGYWHYCLQ